MVSHHDFFDFIPSKAQQSLHKISKIFPPFPKMQKGKTANVKQNTTLQHEGVNLFVIQDADKKTVDLLKSRYSFHPIHLEDIVSPLQRPKIDVEENYIFFVLHFPQYDPSTNKLVSKEIDFFLTSADVIVIDNYLYQPFDDTLQLLIKNQQEKANFFAKGSGILLYKIFDKLIDSIFPMLDFLDEKLDEIDGAVFVNKSRHVIEYLSLLRRNVIFFQTVIKPELNSFLRLEEEKHKLLSRELKTYFSNITDHLKKIWDRLEDLNELSNNLSRTFESYVNYRTNEIIKVLTIFSVVLMPLNLVASIYGMNLTFLPLAQHPQAIFILGIWMLNIVVLMLMFFRVKRWI